MRQRTADDEIWPSLPYAEWEPTLATLHMWAQIVGKVKLELTPFLTNWWNVTFAATARGLTSGMIPFGQRMFQADFDFVAHRLTVVFSGGRSRSMPLAPRSVAAFYQEFMDVRHVHDKPRKPGIDRTGTEECVMQSVEELKAQVERVDLWSASTNDDRCDNCRFFKVLREDIGYCAHKDVDMVVGGPWWCKLWAPNPATVAARRATTSGGASS